MVTREIEHGVATLGHVFLKEWVVGMIENATNVERVNFGID